MEAKGMVLPMNMPTLRILQPDQCCNHKNRQKKPRLPSIQAVVTTPPTDKNLPKLPSSTSNTTYHDRWFDRIAINHFSNCIQAVTGIKCETKGYEGMVEAARTMSSVYINPLLQRELGIRAVEKAFPKKFLYLIKMLLPQSKFTREISAAFTTIFFAWLVGPCEVKEGDFKGRREKHVVHIKKCRFLEGSQCVGMCINLCKFPTQTFIKDSLGTPVTMVPNFDDMSCEMKFGEEPPAPNEDPVSQQPCYTQCKMKRRHNDISCSI